MPPSDVPGEAGRAQRSRSRRDAAARAQCFSMPRGREPSRRSTRSGAATGSRKAMVAGGLYHPVGLNQPDDLVSRAARRQQLGRRRLRSNDGAALSQHQRPRPSHRARSVRRRPLAYERGPASGPLRAIETTRLPCQKPPWGSCTPSIRRRGRCDGRATLGVPTTCRATSKTRGGPTSAGRSSRQEAWSSSAPRTTTAFARSTRGAVACCGRMTLRASAHATPISYGGRRTTICAIVGRSPVLEPVTATGGSFLDSTR